MAHEEVLIVLISVGLLILIITQIAFFLALRVVVQKAETLIDKGQTVVDNAAAFTKAIPMPVKGGVPLTTLAYFLYRKFKRKK